jgi:hypothetical protein
VYNNAGNLTDLSVMSTVAAGGPPSACARFFLCDLPFSTPICVASGETVFRASLNGPACAPPPDAPLNLVALFQGSDPETVGLEWHAPPSDTAESYNVYRGANGAAPQQINASPVIGLTYLDNSPPSGTLCYKVTAVDSLQQEGPQSVASCVTPFSPEQLVLDTHETSSDGAAGPVTTSQILDDRHEYLVTVQGTLSKWSAPVWTAPTTILCGLPEHSPQTPSQNVTNGWVGADAEILFAVPLQTSGSCDQLPLLGYPRHPSDFEIDLGVGFVHIEPLGGTPTDPSPGHLYRYLVRGGNAAASFHWRDSSTDDNYGKLTITVEQAVASDARTVALPMRITVFPSVPNPFNPSTEIRYALPEKVHVEVCIFDVQGRLVRCIFKGDQAGGFHSARWDGRTHSGSRSKSGTYFARVATADRFGVTRLTLIR